MMKAAIVYLGEGQAITHVRQHMLSTNESDSEVCTAIPGRPGHSHSRFVIVRLGSSLLSLYQYPCSTGASSTLALCLLLLFQLEVQCCLLGYPVALSQSSRRMHKDAELNASIRSSSHECGIRSSGHGLSQREN